MALLAHDFIMSVTFIRSFGQLENQNLSIILEDIGRARMVQQFQNGTEEQNGGGMEEEQRSTVVLDDKIALYDVQ